MKRFICFLAFCLPVITGVSQQTGRFTVYFRFDDFTLDAGAKMQLDSLANQLHSAEVKLEAHCDSFGSNVYNDKLSQKRANAVKQYLAARKSVGTNITVKALGKRIPLNSNATEDLRRLNRCVEIFYPLESPEIEGNQSRVLQTDLNLLSIESSAIGTAIKLENINFFGGRHLLLPESGQALTRLLNTLNAFPALEIAIHGYICCEVGGQDGFDFDTRTPNLSETRAKAIYDYLIRGGISASRLSYKGFGSNNKLVEEKTEADKSKNRRVEIVITKK